ncbi:S41 family peptidase [Acidianus brierleyi]|uniref:Tricorn protease homolog n=1 Tax=Acidianus brierleyi TaxID=41673 RepID=A0A2U9IDJ9_9CREN|nr:S41 family peptidase [Acidianus brierleyi]AWR94113.1 peptidase S41 [Acidianus brierleyi]
MQSSSVYLQYPDIKDSQIVFVTEDDLWKLDLNSKKVERLTSDFGIISHPKFSEDGKWIAFTRTQRGDQILSEVYIISSEGGEPERITYFGSPFTNVVGWKDGKVIVSSDYHKPFASWRELFHVDLNGDFERLPYGSASSIAFGSKAVVIGRNTVDLPYWKRYKGGTRGKFWIDYYKGEFEKFLDLNGNLTSPMWINDRFYFISDHEGIGNIYSVDLYGNDLKKHTSFREFYVRNGNSDGKNIVFQSAGDIYVFNPVNDNVDKISINVPISGNHKRPDFVEFWNYFTEFRIKEGVLSVTSRGKSFVMDPWEGPAIQIGLKNGVRYKLTKFIDKFTLVTVSDESGEERLEIYNIKDGNKDVLDLDLGLIEGVFPSPKGNYIVVTNNRFEIWLINIKDKNSKIIDKAEDIIYQVAWHPNESMIAYTYPDGYGFQHIKIYDMQSAKQYDVTNLGNNDFSPSFDPNGDFLFYLSTRNLDPVSDQIYFNFGFLKSVKPYYIPLKKGKSLYKSTLFDNETNNIYLNNLKEKTSSLPIEESNYVKLVAADGKIFLLSYPIKGALSTWLFGGIRSDGILEVYDINLRTKDQWLTNVTDFDIDIENKNLLVRQNKILRIVSTQTKPDLSSQEPGKKSGIIDMSRVKIFVDPVREWSQMFREAWRLMRENYWREDMNGIDWSYIYEKYSKLLSKINSRSELSDLIKEMQGELGTSHAYEMGGDYDVEKPYTIGGLGAEFRYSGECYEITRIYEGDPSYVEEKSPLKDPGVDIEEGDCIVSIDGVKLNKTIKPQNLLINKSGEQVILEVRKKDGKILTFSVRTLKDEKYLIYRDWVEKNRRYVHEITNGKVGYVHIPDMGPRGFIEFFKLYPFEVLNYGKVIIDIRYNGGGMVSQLLIEKLLPKRIGKDVPRRGKAYPYPSYSPEKLVLIINEYAGSDGDIFSKAFKSYNLGKIIGTRTWGGVIGINPRYRLVDGTIVTQPQFAFFFDDVGIGVENYGVDPDIEVEISPQDYAHNKDTQLYKAIDIIQEKNKN